jgi:hypothetical protein
LEGKTGSHGKDFGKLYAEDLETALDYLRRDVELVAEIHGRIML